MGIDASLAALRELPSLVAELERAALDPNRRAAHRLGALAGLLYGVAPLDALSDDLPGGYGYLDDWLVLASSKWVYVRSPEPHEIQTLAGHAQWVWRSLPPEILPDLMQFVGLIASERVAVEQVPETQVHAILEQQLASPAPFQIAIPRTQAVTPRDPMGGWARTANGNQWSDGKSMYFAFSGGGSVGMTRSGKIVGGP